jgi:uncharacterized protein YmfQ (DUF2313 family)
MIAINDILKLTKQLLPTGRAWKVPINGVFENLIKGLAESEVRAYNFALGTLDRILPDNDNFTAEDATEWERRLGLVQQPTYVSLTQRKAIILRKLQYPGNFLARQNYRYIEAQLQLAGFAVTVTENFDPDYIIGVALQHSEDTEHGYDSEMGSTTVDLVANSAFQGELYDVSSPLGCFIITGTISPNLITAFRKLILTLKPANTVAVLNVDYVTTGDLSLVNGSNLFLINGSNFVLMSYS